MTGAVENGQKLGANHRDIRPGLPLKPLQARTEGVKSPGQLGLDFPFMRGSSIMVTCVAGESVSVKPIPNKPTNRTVIIILLTGVALANFFVFSSQLVRTLLSLSLLLIELSCLKWRRTQRKDANLVLPLHSD